MRWTLHWLKNVWNIVWITDIYIAGVNGEVMRSLRVHTFDVPSLRSLKQSSQARNIPGSFSLCYVSYMPKLFQKITHRFSVMLLTNTDSWVSYNLYARRCELPIWLSTIRSISCLQVWCFLLIKQALVAIEDEYQKLVVNTLGIMWNATTDILISMSSKVSYRIFVICFYDR